MKTFRIKIENDVMLTTRKGQMYVTVPSDLFEVKLRGRKPWSTKRKSTKKKFKTE